MRREAREAEEKFTKMKNELIGVIDKVQKETEVKFKRVLTLDAQVGSLK